MVVSFINVGNLNHGYFYIKRRIKHFSKCYLQWMKKKTHLLRAGIVVYNVHIPWTIRLHEEKVF